MPDSQFVHDAFSSIAMRYVAANHLLSLGIDVLWRARALEIVAEWRPANLLDIATGTGDMALDIQRELPEIQVLGVDFCEPMLTVAQQRGLRHALQADAMHLPLADDSYDAITTAFGLRNLPNYADALREFRRVLHDGGHLLVLDLSIPTGIVAAPYRFYLHRILPLLAGWFTGQREAYTYLGTSIEQFPRAGAFIQMLRETGYSCPTALSLCGGIAVIYTAEA